MDRPRPISITMNYFDGESPDAKAIRFIQGVLQNFLSGDEMAQLRALQYCEQKLNDSMIKQYSEPIGIGQLQAPITADPAKD